MRKEIFNGLKQEFLHLSAAFAVFLIIIKIAFYNESFLAVARNAASIFWLFVLPGYFVMLYWKESLSFAERLAAGIALSAGIMGISSYYMGLVGLNIKYHAVLLPLALIIMGFIAALKKK